jgi:hypothetical protein
VSKFFIFCSKGAIIVQLMVVGAVMSGSIIYFSNRVSSVKERLIKTKKAEAHKSVMRGVMAYGYNVLKERIHINAATGLIDPAGELITSNNNLERLLLKNNTSNDLETLYGSNGVQLPELVNYFNTNEHIGMTEYSFTVDKNDITASHPLYVVFHSGAEGKKGQKIRYHYKSDLTGATSEILVEVTATLIGENGDEIAHAKGRLIYYPRQINQFSLVLSRNAIVPPVGGTGPSGTGDGVVQEDKFNLLNSEMTFMSPVMINGDLIIPEVGGGKDVLFMSPILVNGIMRQGTSLDAEKFSVGDSNNHLAYLSQFPGFTGIKQGAFLGNYELALENIFAHNSSVVDTTMMRRCIDYQNRKYDISLTNGSALLVKRFSPTQLLLGLTKENEVINAVVGSLPGLVEVVVGTMTVQLKEDEQQIFSLTDAEVIVPAAGSNIVEYNGAWAEEVITPAVVCPPPPAPPATPPPCTPSPASTSYMPVTVPQLAVSVHRRTDFSKSVVELRYNMDTIDTLMWSMSNDSLDINVHSFLTDPATGSDTRPDLLTPISGPKGSTVLEFTTGGDIILGNLAAIDDTWKKTDGTIISTMNANEAMQLTQSNFFDYGICDGTTTTGGNTSIVESYDLSYADVSHTSWNYNNIYNGADASGGSLGQYYPPSSAAVYGSYYNRNQALRNSIDFTSGNHSVFHSLSIMDRCVVKSSATQVIGFLVCRHLIIENRSTKLTMVGSFVVDKFSNDSTGETVWLNIFHPEARPILDLTGNGFKAASSTDCKVNPSSPLWRTGAISAMERANLLRCDPAFFLEKADPFRWTTFDPLCGLIGASATGTTCKPGSRSLNFWFTVLNERYW